VNIALIRHGPTEWNAAGRVQGTIDTPLSVEGRTLMAGLRPPEGFEAVRAFVSPQLRARQTAELLGIAGPTIDPRLREQNWGMWEGLTIAEMKARDGEDCLERAGRGVAFRPRGGEATHELMARVRSFLIDAGKTESPAVAVAHMGVLRTAFALATGWDMASKMPAELDLRCALVLAVTGETIAVAALNQPLRKRSD
jgi:broad specificity phosphatase PhoE